MLKLAKLDPERDAIIVFVGSGPEMMSAMLAGRTDAVVSADPNGDLAAAKFGAVILFHGAAGGYPGLGGTPNVVLVTPRRWAAFAPDRTRRVLEALRLGEVGMKNPAVSDTTRDRVHATYLDQMQKNVFDVAWRSVVPAFPSSPALTVEQMQKNLDFPREALDARYRVAPDKVFTNQHIKTTGEMMRPKRSSRARCAACILAALLPVSASPHAQPSPVQPQASLSIGRQGYFFVGGGLYPYSGDQTMAGQMFVQYQVPAGATKPYPVVMVHGGGQTGTNFLGTPDGRPGWNDWFLRQGYAVYIVDQPARGRSSYFPPAQGPVSSPRAQAAERLFTAPEKYNLWPQAKLHTQWPGTGQQGDPTFEQFLASQEPSLTDGLLTDESNRDDLLLLLQRIGPAILLTHSRSGPFGWLVADARPDLVRAILAVEPSGPPFMDAPPLAAAAKLGRPWGLSNAKLHFDPPADDPASLAPTLQPSVDGPDAERCWLAGGSKRSLPALARVPILIVTSEAGYHARYDRCTVRFLAQNGVAADHIELAAVGIHGNGHMMMLEKNNEQIAKVLTDWLDRHITR